MEILKVLFWVKDLWRKVAKDRVYQIQLAGAVLLVLINYTAGPFLSDEVIIGIGTALAIPEPLWQLLVIFAQKVRSWVRKEK